MAKRVRLSSGKVARVTVSRKSAAARKATIRRATSKVKGKAKINFERSVRS